MLFTYYDTETSGKEKDCDVLSFSYMLADENLRVERAETLYFWKEGRTKWTQDAYKMHGLSKEFLRQFEADYETNLRKMYIILSKAELVGWNSGRLNDKKEIVGFDFVVCRNFLQRNGFPAPYGSTLHDAMILYSSWKHRRWTKLVLATELEEISSALIEAYVSGYFGAKGTEAHNSAYDTVCTAMLFAKIYAAGYVYGDNTDSGPTGPMQDIADWMLKVGEDGALHAYSEFSGEDYALSDFSVKFPLVYKRIMENPAQYLQ